MTSVSWYLRRRSLGRKFWWNWFLFFSFRPNYLNLFHLIYGVISLIKAIKSIKVNDLLRKLLFLWFFIVLFLLFLRRNFIHLVRCSRSLEPILLQISVNRHLGLSNHFLRLIFIRHFGNRIPSSLILLCDFWNIFIYCNLFLLLFDKGRNEKYCLPCSWSFYRFLC